MASNNNSESPSERQENEMEVIRAIYMDDVEDLRGKDAWQVKRPPEMKILLKPQESMNDMEAHVSLILYVKCSTLYPDELPVIKLENPKGLSNSQVTALQEELCDMAKKLKGEVMVLELAQHVQKYLHAHNKPPTKSFYEEMLSNKKKQEEKIAQDQQKKMELLKKKEEKQYKEIEDQIQRRREALKEESRRRRREDKMKNFDRSSSSEPSTPSGEPSTPSGEIMLMTPIPKDTEQRTRPSSSPLNTPNRQILISDSGSYQKPERKRRTSTPKRGERQNSEEKDDCIGPTGTVVLAFNTKKERVIHRGKCIGHSQRGSTVYVGLENETGELVAVIEWVLKWRLRNRKLDGDELQEEEKEVTKYKKQVVVCEQDLSSLQKLRHKNLIQYLAFKYHYTTGIITIHVLTEYVNGTTIASQLESGIPEPMEVLRHHTIQLLEVISYLHDKAVVHKDLRASSVFVDQNRNIRLADYGLERKMAELYKNVEAKRPGVKFSTNELPTLVGKAGKKADIYRLGILVLSMALSENVSDIMPEIPTHLPQEFQHFASKCLMKDEIHRWSAHELLDHTFVKTPVHLPLASQRKLNKEQGEEEEATKNQIEEKDEDQDIPFIPSTEGGHSRLKSEFEILKWLGKGGFGDVIKVKNKLDGRQYAIKRIPLNPKSKQFTKKITREVKLLSRLNHENVVRYYNSWIETSDDPALSESSSTFTDSTSSRSVDKNDSFKTPFKTYDTPNSLKNSLGFQDDIEKLAPAQMDGSVDWSMSMSHHTQSVTTNDSSSDEEEEDEDVFGTSFLQFCDDDDDDEDDDGGIVFEQESKYHDWSQSAGNSSISQNKDNQGKDINTFVAIPKIQFLYIQMEFCEKSTLRNCIDAGLYQDMNRVWRLFREMIEGLSHIHEQGMIHRDLKPVNIFLDSNDHVKIGDFGLATTDIITKQQTSLLDMTMNPNVTDQHSSSRSDSLGDGDLTGKVGTALYVSPEIMNATSRTNYNQKVDIYSLGIMFFEMCYKPLDTGMERVKVLTNLRQPTVDLPEDFDEIEMPDQAHIIRWLLSHDSMRRPTAKELLQSEHLPPPQMEEAELTEVLRSTISNPESKSYKHLMNAIFSQPVTPAMDYMYDIDMYKGSFSSSQYLAQGMVMNTLIKIFKHHGAVRISTSLLMPKSTLYEHNDQYACLVNHDGGLVALPHDLRIPFARFILRNNVMNIKRYSIEKVYREKRFYGNHPKELTECAFDIVTNYSASFIPDAEVIHAVTEIINEFPSLQERNYYLVLNHTDLLAAVLMYSGVPLELHQEVYSIIGDLKGTKQQKLQVQTRLCSLSLTDDCIETLYRLIEAEGPFGKVSSLLKCITKTRGQAGSMAKKGLHELEAIIGHAEAMGCKMQPIISLGNVYNIQHYSGFFFQVVSNVKRKRKVVMDVLAAGGRYDKLINHFRKPSSSSSAVQNAVGVSIAFEKLVLATTESEENQSVGLYDALVCSWGHKSMLREKLLVIKDLWAAGLSSDVYHDNIQDLEEVQEYCRNRNISHIVILKDVESGVVKVRSAEKDKFVEKKVNTAEVAEYLQQKLSLDSQETNQVNVGSVKTPNHLSLSNSESTFNPSSGGGLSYTIAFITSDNSKMANNAKRRFESQIHSNINAVLARLSNKCKIEVLGLMLDVKVLKTIAAFIEVSGEETAFESSLGSIIEKHMKHKKYLTKIFDHIHDLKFDKNYSVIVLYGLEDNSYRVLL